MNLRWITRDGKQVLQYCNHVTKAAARMIDEFNPEDNWWQDVPHEPTVQENNATIIHKSGIFKYQRGGVVPWVCPDSNGSFSSDWAKVNCAVCLGQKSIAEEKPVEQEKPKRKAREYHIECTNIMLSKWTVEPRPGIVTVGEIIPIREILPGEIVVTDEMLVEAIERHELSAKPLYLHIWDRLVELAGENK